MTTTRVANALFLLMCVNDDTNDSLFFYESLTGERI
jgi:hypothetical protein